MSAYDPVAMEEAKHDLGDTITYCESDMDAVQGADALALITDWTEFRTQLGESGRCHEDKGGL